MMWRTAVRRVAQNNHMAVGSLAGIRAMTTKQFAAWRRKLIRHIAGEEILAKNRERWEGILNAETDREFELIREENGKYNTEGAQITPKGKMDRKQRRTAVQAAGDASERADATIRRAGKGWEAPRMRGTRGYGRRRIGINGWVKWTG